ncbi:hypothetical protein R2R35_05040 [Anaerocolumna sp. AGMB13020]|uniref:hypothetical protein n=1 Tax=Anaerocolumna sp. AGMB13020 TaxID=3081750 RepID=UPI002955AF12|nr:hypothetical protein [Anaerocolumna sp. AGMB13020]WOO37870.1 hypothetical protein R2R35_05040 [Anaerocolumna sp. AGMB13020]
MDEILQNNERKSRKGKSIARGKRQSRKIVFIAVLGVLLLAAGTRLFFYFYGDNKTSQVIKFDTEEVMRVKNEKVVMNEFLLYAADVYQGYNLQNEADWDMEVSDSSNNTVTFEKQVKGTICEQIRMTKVLCMIAKEEGIALSEDEKNILLENANTYYGDLNAAKVVDKSLTVDLIAKFYEENALAQKVYNSIIDSYDESQEAAEDSDSGDSDLSAGEMYFIEKYHDLAEEYNGEYDYYTSINWGLLEQLSFAEIGKDETEEAQASEADVSEKNNAVSDKAQEATQADTQESSTGASTGN